MMRCLAVAALLGMLRVQDAPAEKDLNRFEALLNERRWTEAARRLEELGEAHPRWDGFRDRVLRLSGASYDFKAVDRAAVLALLREVQNREPRLGQDPGFSSAVERVLTWSFLSLPKRLDPSELETLHPPLPPAPPGKTRPPSIFTTWWIHPTRLERARAEALADADDVRPFWTRVPRAEWTRRGRETVEGNEGVTPVLGHSGNGLYVMEEEVEGLSKSTPLFVAPWALAVKILPGELVAYAMNPESGQAVPGIRVGVAAAGKLHEGTTGPDGLLRLAVTGATRLIADRDREYQELQLHPAGEAGGSLVYISTDRPVYRPGQTVSFKAVRRDRADGRLALPARGPVRVEVLDPLGRSIHAADPSWNEHGSLSGAVTLGEEPPLGQYTVRVQVPNREDTYYVDEPPLWTSTFTVAAYRKPEMSVQVEFPAERPVLGEKVRAVVRATYLFGGAVPEGQVEWTVSRRAPWWYRSPSRTADVDASRAWFFERPDEDGDDGWVPFKEGKGTLQADGSCAVEFEPEEMEGYKGHAHEFQVAAVVTDLSRFTAEGSASLAIPTASLLVAVESSRRFARPGRALDVRVRATTIDGRPLAAREIELSAYTDRGERGPDDEVEFELFYRGSARSGEDGRAVFTVTPEPAGRMRLRARAKDERGRWAVDRFDLPLDDDAFDRETDRDDLVVVPERRVYEPGDTARLLVRSPRRGLQAWLTIEGGRFLASRLVTLTRTTETLELPVGADWPREVCVKLCAWKGKIAHGGGAVLAVYPRDGVLDVSVRADKATYAPGEKARVTLSTSAAGAGVPAEVEIGIVDEAIFGIRKEETGDIRSFFHRKPHRQTLVEGTEYVPDDVDDGEGRRPLGGALVGATFALEEKAEPGETNATVRREFPDTMFWRAHAVTDAAGKAEIEVEVPDSLTTWRFTARAVAGASRFGEARSNAVCRKDVMVRLAAPRFFTERDRGTVSTIVHNERTEDAVFKVRLEAEGLEVEGGERELRVRAGGAERLDWKVSARKAGRALLRARVAGGDAMEIRLPVLPHGLEEASGAAGIVEGRWNGKLVLPADAVEGSAVLEVSVRAPGTAAVLDALPYLAGYPYGCVEQTMSRFLPAVVAAQALKRLGIRNPALEAELPKMAAAGMARLYDFQHEDGGWGWWKTDRTHEFMTAYAMYGLLTARAAGFEVREDVLKRGLESVEAQPGSALGVWVRARMGRPIADEAPPQDAEGLAWFVLAGRKDLAGKLPGQPPGRGMSDDVRRVALSIRALLAAAPEDPRIPKLVEWLMLQRQGATWNSTLDTAYAVFALCDLAAGRPEPGSVVRVNGREVSAPDGRIRVDATGLQAGPNAVEVERRGEGLLFASALLRWRSAEESLRPAAGTIEVSRRVERWTAAGQWEPLESGAEVKAGEDLRISLTLRAKGAERYVMLECPLPAGAEPREDRPGQWDEQFWYARRELRDDRVCLAVEDVRAHVLEFAFRARPALPDEYHMMPARAFAMYDPDRRGNSGEFLLRVK